MGILTLLGEDVWL
jgi:hypothetical protein